MTWTVYKVTHIATGRSYVGCSRQPDIRWKQHLAAARSDSQQPLHVAMRTFGADAFIFSVVSVHESRLEGYGAENDLIRSGRFYEPHGFNRPYAGGATYEKRVAAAAARGRTYYMTPATRRRREHAGLETP